MKRSVDILFEHTLELGGDGAPHQIQRINRKERVHDIGLDVKAPNEALGLDFVKLALVLDAGQRFRG